MVCGHNSACVLEIFVGVVYYDRVGARLDQNYRIMKLISIINISISEIYVGEPCVYQ